MNQKVWAIHSHGQWWLAIQEGCFWLDADTKVMICRVGSEVESVNLTGRDSELRQSINALERLARVVEGDISVQAALGTAKEIIARHRRNDKDS